METCDGHLLGKSLEGNIVTIKVGEKGVVSERGIKFHTAMTKLQKDTILLETCLEWLTASNGLGEDFSRASCVHSKVNLWKVAQTVIKGKLPYQCKQIIGYPYIRRK
jgi:hypothetical protein